MTHHPVSESPTDTRIYQDVPVIGRNVSLCVITPDHYKFLQAAELAPALRGRWRYRGATPSPEQWSQLFWNGMLAQFLVTATRSGRPIGVVGGYGANFQHGWAYVAAAKFDPTDRSPRMILGVGIFLEYMFRSWNFRKLYLEVPEFNYPQFGTGEGTFFTIEGRLRNHTFYDGQYWDEFLLSVERSSWQVVGQRLLGIEGVGASNAAHTSAGSE